MKKLLVILTFSFLGYICAQFVFNKREFVATIKTIKQKTVNQASKYNKTLKTDNNQAQKVVSLTLEEYLESSTHLDFEKIYSDNSISAPKVFGKIQNSFKTLLSCIAAKTCVEDGHGTSSNLAFYKLKQTLDVLSMLTLDDNEYLDQVRDEDLITVISLGHQASSVQSYTLLLRKGNIHFSKIFPLASDFKGNMMVTFLKNFQNESIFHDDETQKVRKELFLKYTTNATKSDVNGLISVFGKIDFSSNELKDYLEILCPKIERNNSESTHSLINRINRLSIQNAIDFKC